MICKKCKSIINDNFCAECGTSSFESGRKKSKWPLISLAALALIAVVGLTYFFVLHNRQGELDARIISVFRVDGEEVSLLNAGARMATDFAGSYIWWWLRSPVFPANRAAYVHGNGYLSLLGFRVFWPDGEGGGIRPALWLILDNVAETEIPQDIVQPTEPALTELQSAALAFIEILQGYAGRYDGTWETAVNGVKLVEMGDGGIPILIVDHYRYTYAYAYANGSANGVQMATFGGSVAETLSVVTDNTGMVFLERTKMVWSETDEIVFITFSQGEPVWGRQPANIVSRRWELLPLEMVLTTLRGMVE